MFFNCKSPVSLLLTLTLLFALVLPGCTPLTPEVTDPSAAPSPTVPTEKPTEAPTEPTQTPTEPPVRKEATATVGATGDLLMHQSVIDSGFDKTTGSYDYRYIFTALAPFVQKLDYAAANLEVTLGGAELGYGGYPKFNSPDAIVDAAKNAGFDMLLTANNHSYDSRSAGFHRTLAVIQDRKLDYLGTRPAEDVPPFVVKDVNGIKIGMICYTYNTGDKDGKTSLNCIPLTKEDTGLINTFNYGNLDAFYRKLSGELDQMKAQGAEALMVFLHWGDEYHTRQNPTQEKIAQQLSNLGVDVIVGGHPHVVQPMDTIPSETDPSHNLICLYSMGNSVSNIRKTDRRPAQCEDGILFSVTFAKYSDGTVIVEKADVLPYYVNKYWDSASGRSRFPIVPLAGTPEDWRQNYGLTDAMTEACRQSLSRTNAIIGEGLQKTNLLLAERQQALEAKLGIQK